MGTWEGMISTLAVLINFSSFEFKAANKNVNFKRKLR